MVASSERLKSTVRGAVALFALGMLGVAALAVYSVPSLREIPELAILSYPTLVLLASINSTILLIAFVLLGSVSAPRIGLTSHVYSWASGSPTEWGAFRASLPLAAALGIGLFVAVAILDVAFAPFTQLPVDETITETAALNTLLASVPMRLLYGGITEEILLRWGVMAPVAFAIWWIRNRLGDDRKEPSDATMWAAIIVSAVLFGIGHLPALASTVGLTTQLIVRTVLLNALVGIALGWLFWRRSLEAAMVAHAMFHVALVAVSVVLIWL